MKIIEVDDELYRYIASQTKHIGESASDILRRILLGDQPTPEQPVEANIQHVEQVAPDSSDTSNEDLLQMLSSTEFRNKKKVVDRFMAILSVLYSMDQKTFSEATKSVGGRSRLYFSDNQENLLASGNTTKPKNIPNTPFWVITNTNTPRKRQMLIQLMENMNFSKQEIEQVSVAI